MTRTDCYSKLKGTPTLGGGGGGGAPPGGGGGGGGGERHTPRDMERVFV